jgi:hypothetical protein
MPFRRKGHRSKRKCKYCDRLAKINYWGIKRRHKGYLRTCGRKECLEKQYRDKVVNQKKSYLNKKIKIKCIHCGNGFIKESITQKWCKECVPDNKARGIIRRYGLNKKEYLELINEVNGICPICKKNKATVVDHCHKTGKVRGFICQHCNTALNLVENKKALERALQYLDTQ